LTNFSGWKLEDDYVWKTDKDSRQSRHAFFIPYNAKINEITLKVPTFLISKYITYISATFRSYIKLPSRGKDERICQLYSKI